MNRSRCILVSKRDGGVELFDAAKPRRCLSDAMRGCGCDARFADALTRAIELHLREWPPTRPPTTDYVFRCLRTALTETGMGQVARRLAAHRRQRALQRRGIAVRSRDPAAPARPWRKAAVAEALECRYGIRHSVARYLAREVECRVLGLQYTTVSTALIDELIQSELRAWGLVDTIRDDVTLVNRHDDLVADGQSRKN